MTINLLAKMIAEISSFPSFLYLLNSWHIKFERYLNNRRRSSYLLLLFGSDLSTPIC